MIRLHRAGQYSRCAGAHQRGNTARLASVCAVACCWLLASSGCCCLDRLYCPAECAGSCEGGGGCNGCATSCLRTNLTCGAGCGDVYWGEWMSDPPDACDPCNNCGNWTGSGCCPPGLLDCLCGSLSCLFGGRNGGCGGCCEAGAGCSTCGGHGGEMMEGEMIHEGEIIPRGAPAMPRGTPKPAEPVAAPSPITAAPRGVPHRSSGMRAATPHRHPNGLRPAGATAPIRQRSI
jgi:hypothetical protein